MRFFIFLILFFLKFNFVFSEEKIAFIDINYIMNNSVSGKSINKFINDIRNKKINKFKDLENKIKIDENELISKKILLTRIFIIQKLMKSGKELIIIKLTGKVLIKVSRKIRSNIQINY